MAGYLLGIDIGTTACKSVIFDLNGRTIAKASKEYPIYYPKPGWAEQDADWWWNAVRITTEESLRKARKHGEDVIGVGIDSQREAPVALDVHGRKLATSLIWMDKRTIPQVQKIRKLLSLRKVIEATGAPIDPLYSAPKIMWMKEKRPSIFRKTRIFLFPKDYIIYRLTNEMITDHSMASRTMLYDIRKRKWHDEICQKLDISVEMLPSPADSPKIVGEVLSTPAKLTGLRKGTPVVAGGGDRPCEAIGGGVCELGYVNIGSGTSTVMTTPLLKPKVDMRGRIDCCCHVIPGMWEYEVPILTTGASLRWFRDNFGYEEIEKSEKTGVDPYVYLDMLAREVELGSNSLFYYPYPMGAKSPKFASNAKAAFFGITLIHTKAHLVRAILEGVAFQYAETLELLEELGVKVKQASLVGGEARSQLWNQIKADALSRSIRLPDVEDAAALGSAMLSSIGVKVYKNMKNAVRNMVRTRTIYRPRRKESLMYSAFYEQYKKVYEFLKHGYDVIA